MTLKELRIFRWNLYAEIFSEDKGDRSIVRGDALKEVHRKTIELEIAMVELRTIEDLEAQKMRRDNERALANIINTMSIAAE